MFWIATPHRAVFRELKLNSADAIARYFFGEIPPNKSGVEVIRRDLPAGNDSIPLFCKQYFFAKPSWKFIGRNSKARCEWMNYAVFTRLGIRCAEAIACGEERDAIGRLRRAFIITREIPSAQTLTDSFRTTSLSPEIRAKLIRQIAEMTARIHNANFFHHDLVWRNILVTRNPAPELWWIDCPRGQFDRWSPLRNRRRLKDLASLDKVASQLCAPRERLQFMKIYLRKNKLDDEAKKLVRAVLNYRKKRWPEDWVEPHAQKLARNSP